MIRAWLNFCVKRRWLRESPFQLDLNDIRTRADNVEHPRILTPAEAHALLQSARTQKGGALVPFVVLSVWCFMRRAEVLRTKADQIHLEAKEPCVEILPRKRGTVSYRDVAIPANVLPLLRAAVAQWPATKQARDKPSEKLADVPFTVPFSRSAWDAVRAEAGLIERAPGQSGKRRKHASSLWQENLLRHTGISYFYRKTKDIRETCRQAGTGDDTAFRHYLRLPKEGDEAKFYAG